ncbi:1742_t:CDS:2, partial [Gigaspora margarita]
MTTTDKSEREVETKKKKNNYIERSVDGTMIQSLEEYDPTTDQQNEELKINSVNPQRPTFISSGPEKKAEHYK